MFHSGQFIIGFIIFPLTHMGLSSLDSLDKGLKVVYQFVDALGLDHLLLLVSLHVVGHLIPVT